MIDQWNKNNFLLTQNTDAMQRLNDFAENEFLNLFDKYKGAISHLSETQKRYYNRLTASSPGPVAIPCQVSDLIVVRAEAKGYVFDILEPHDPSRKDNCAKAVGLAKFAESHWDKFGRIELIRQTRDGSPGTVPNRGVIMPCGQGFFLFHSFTRSSSAV